MIIWLAMAGQAQTGQSMEGKHDKLEQATFGAGCFWCVEAVFEQLEGVVSVEAGYAGGHVKNPSYREVCNGRTGHAEVAQITFDPSVISYETLLEVFWHSHNPTTLNRQGADKGTQYRSAIFYHNEEQKQIAEKSLKNTDKSNLWDDPIVTTIEPLENYSKAENYHQNYFENNRNAPYCSAVIKPKLEKLRKDFPGLLK
jgi:peptide-methionine (S)-S-oxide reductase